VRLLGLLKRAWLYIIRKKGRSILLFLVLFVTAAFMLAAISIYATSTAEMQRVRETLGSSFKLEPDLDVANESLWVRMELENGSSGAYYIGPALSENVVDQVMQTEGIRDYFVVDTTGLLDTALTFRPGLWQSEYDMHLANEEDEYYAEWAPLASIWRHSTKIYTVSDSELHDFFRNGSFTLVEGRHIREDDLNKVVISEDTAERNGLDIGDTFEVRKDESFLVMDAEIGKTIGEPIPLEIVGIYRVNFSYEPSEYTAEEQIAENFMFSDLDLSWKVRVINAAYKNQALPSDYKHKFDYATFFVDDPEALDGVMEKVRTESGIDWQYFNMEKDDTAYLSQIGPLKTISGLGLFLMIALIAGCVVILYLIIAMRIRGRRREIGIFRAMGIKRSHVLAQLVAEGLLIAAVSFTAVFFAAAPITNMLGDAAAGWAEAEPAAERYEVSYTQLGGNRIEQVSAGVDLDYTVDAGAFWAVCALEGGMIIASVALSSAAVLRMSPRRILDE
jgi:hypothetical protein